MNKIILILSLALLLGLGAWSFVHFTAKTHPSESDGPLPPIRLHNLERDGQITSPFTLSGSATNRWFFEGSFPVVLTDANGTVLFQGAAEAKGDWTTPGFVPFEVTLTFGTPATATGKLILKKDNPSGLPENDEEFNMPVSF